MAKSFEGKVVWITGASSGIGEQLSYEFARQGASLILSAPYPKALELVKANIQQAEVILLPFNLEDLDTLPEIADTAISAFGRIDYLINNAGLAIRDYAMNTDLAIDQKLMNVNYFGPVTLTKLLLPHFLEQGTGHIAVTSSLAGKYGVPRTAAYSASKHALHGFFESMRSEVLDKNIHITMLVPGLIKTNITAHALKGDGSNFGEVERTFRSAYPADKCARKMVKAIRKKREEVFIGRSEIVTLWLQRISPWLNRRFIRNHPLKKLRKVTTFLGIEKRRLSK